MEVTRGSITDRPWGLTLAALGMRGFSGEMVLSASGMEFRIGFSDGVLVSALSPASGDRAVKIAVAARLVPPEHAEVLAQEVAARPDQDEIEVVAARAGLGAEDVSRLRRRAIAQRTARTFATDRGDFTLHDTPSADATPATSVDVHAAIYLGARVYMSPERLAAEIAKYGDRFGLSPDAGAALRRFGFTDQERAVLDKLRIGASLGELEAVHRDPRTAHAVVYALLACRACGPSLAQMPAAHAIPLSAPPVVRATTETAVRAATTPTTPAPSRGAPNTTTPPMSHPASRAPSPSPSSPPSSTIAASASTAPMMPAQPLAVRAARGTTPWISPDTRPGQAPGPSPGRTAAGSDMSMRRPGATKPERALGPHPPERDREPTAPPATAPAAPISKEDRAALAKNAFRRGERALDDNALDRAITELNKAVELVPNDMHYQATLAWAQFCAATDKNSVAEATRQTLARAILKSNLPESALFYLGRVERMLGREQEALRRFKAVLAVRPDHRDAASEVRVLEARLANRR